MLTQCVPCLIALVGLILVLLFHISSLSSSLLRFGRRWWSFVHFPWAFSSSPVHSSIRMETKCHDFVLPDDGSCLKTLRCVLFQAQLRAFIPEMLKYSTGRGKPGWGKESCKPIWWPEDIPWANVRSDVRTEEQKQRVRGCVSAFRLGQDHSALQTCNLCAVVSVSWHHEALEGSLSHLEQEGPLHQGKCSKIWSQEKRDSR